MMPFVAEIVKGGLFKIGGKIADWIPGRDESMRTNVDKIKREMDEILHKKITLRSIGKYEFLSGKLRVLETKLANR